MFIGTRTGTEMGVLMGDFGYAAYQYAQAYPENEVFADIYERWKELHMSDEDISVETMEGFTTELYNATKTSTFTPIITPETVMQRIPEYAEMAE
jgi:hypothetical protein